jgi:tetratricopeptide (TPR) repeat protein
MNVQGTFILKVHVVAIAGLAATLLASPAFAQASPKDVELCDKGSGDASLAACTRVINNKGTTVSNRAVAYTNRGVEYRRKDDLDRAMADYNEAIRINPRYAIAYYDRGNAWRAKGDQDRAIADYDQALKLDPKQADALVARGNAWRDKGNLDRAIASHSDAMKVDPKYSLAYYNRGLAWRDKGDYDRAIADYTEAIRLKPEADAYHLRASAWRFKADYDRSLMDYDAAIKLAPNGASHYRDRGYANFDKGDFAAAAADMLRANEIGADSYAMLARFIARARLRQDGSAELSANAAQLKDKDWPYAVIEFYLGRRSSSEMSKAASDADERCEVEFYLGEWNLMKGNKADAKPPLQKAAETCRKTYAEYTSAVAELKRLGP